MRQCPLWVKSGHKLGRPFTSAFGGKADIAPGTDSLTRKSVFGVPLGLQKVEMRLSDSLRAVQNHSARGPRPGPGPIRGSRPHGYKTTQDTPAPSYVRFQGLSRRVREGSIRSANSQERNCPKHSFEARNPRLRQLETDCSWGTNERHRDHRRRPFMMTGFGARPTLKAAPAHL